MSKTSLLSKIELVVIGASAGGIEIFNKLLPAFKRSSNLKVALVLHLPPTGPNLLPSLMGPICELEVSEALAGEPMLPGHIYIAPPDYHLCVEPDLSLSLSNEEAQNYSRPSIDILFESAAYSGRERTLGILLTGANEDGARGMELIRKAGGITIVQDPRDAQYPTMPQSALDLIDPHYVLPISEIVKLVSELSPGGETHA